MRHYSHRIELPYLLALCGLVVLSTSLYWVWIGLEYIGAVPVIYEAPMYWSLYGLYYAGSLGFLALGYSLPLYRLPERIVAYAMAFLLYIDGIQELFDLDSSLLIDFIPLGIAVVIGLLAYAFLRRMQSRERRTRYKRNQVGFRFK